MFLGMAAGCSGNAPRQIEIGQTRDAVIVAVGEPDEITEFIIPEVPFFGPQESLASRLAAGTLVEEWHYVSEEEITYVWVAGDSGQAREDWEVIDTVTAPADAVY